MEAIQTRKAGVFSLEMVISRDPAASSRAPNREVQLALPPGHRSVLPVAPRLVSHIDFSSERGVLIVGEDVWERGLKVTSLVINHNLLAGQRRLLLFKMAPRPICCRAFERVGPLVHHYVSHTHRHSKWGTGLSYICSQQCGGLEVALCERFTTAGSISASS